METIRSKTSFRNTKSYSGVIVVTLSIGREYGKRRIKRDITATFGAKWQWVKWSYVVSVVGERLAMPKNTDGANIKAKC